MSSDEEPTTGGAEQHRARIFISYSRRDFDFADRVNTALKARNFDTLIDRSDIYALEDWWNRIEALITHADTIVFILSPDAIISPVCQREVRFAASLNKRLAPIVYRRVDNGMIPAELARLNFVFFDDPAQFNASVNLLAAALETDIEWVRKHTEFGEQARRWMIAGQPGPRGLLLRPPLLDEAERWIASRPQGAPLPTEATQGFIAASRQAFTRRRNIVIGSLTAGLLGALVLAGIAYWQRDIAVAQRKIAIEQTRIAEQRLDTAYRRDSAYVAERSNQLRQQHDNAQAALVALSGLPNSLTHPNRPIVNEALLALGEATLLDPAAGILRGHTERVYAGNFSHDGHRIVTASEDGTSRVWDATSGRELRLVRPGSGPLAGAQFSSNDQWIAICGDNGLVQINDAASGQVVRRLIGNTSEQDQQVRSVAFSHDNRRIAAAYSNGTAAIWDTATGRLLVRLQGHDGPATSVAFDASDRRIVTGGEDAKARIWDSFTGNPLLTISGHRDWVDSVEFSPDGSQIATASEDGTARIWNAANGTLVHSLEKHTDKVFQISFGPDGSRVITASKDKTAKIWDVGSGELVDELIGHTGFVYSAHFSSDGEQIVTTSEDGTARLWRLTAGVKAVTQIGQPIIYTNLMQNDRILMIGTDDGTLYSWDFAAGHPVPTLQSGHTSEIRHMVSSTKDELVLSVSEDSSTYIRRLADGRLLKTISSADYPKSPFESKSIAYPISVFNSRNDVISISGNSSIIGIWRYPYYQQASFFSGHSGIVNSLTLNRQGTEFITASNDHTAKIWDATTGAEIRTLVGHSAAVQTAEFSRDGRRVLTTALDDTVRIWDAGTGHQISEIKGPFENPYDALAPELGKQLVNQIRAHVSQPVAVISPDGRKVVTNAPGYEARIWDANSGTLLATLQGHEGTVLAMMFSPDARFIITTSQDGSARVWDSSMGLPTATLDALGGAIADGVIPSNGKEVLLHSYSNVIADFDLSRVRPDILLDYARASAFLPAVGDNMNLATVLAAGENSSGPVGNPAAECDDRAGNPLDTANARQEGHLAIANPEDALAACQKALDQEPNTPRLQYQAARALNAKGNRQDAFELATKACDAGYAAACNLAGVLLQNDEKIAPPERHAPPERYAIDFYRKAVSLGSVQAEYYLGQMYWDGNEGMAADKDAGLKLFSEAARHGDPFSNRKLGEIYAARGDFAVALFHLSIAAQVFERLALNDEAAVAIALRGTLARHMDPAMVAAVWRDKVAPWVPDTDASIGNAR